MNKGALHLSIAALEAALAQERRRVRQAEIQRQGMLSDMQTLRAEKGEAILVERERCASKLVTYIAEWGGTRELRAIVDAIRKGE
jgi:hypothetical protein